MKPGDFLTKHRNAFLLGLLLVTLCVSGISNQQRLAADEQTVSIPVMSVSNDPADALTAYKQERDAVSKSDMAALEALCSEESLEQQTREDAAVRLQQLVDSHQAQLDLEGALLDSSLYPCVAVVSPDSVTIVTQKKEITAEDTALVLTLAAAHTEADAANVRIITAGN